MKKHIQLNRLLVALATAAVGTAAHAQYAKMDGGLSDYVDSLAIAKTGKTANGQALKLNAKGGRSASKPMIDDAGRVLVDLYLDGSVSIEQFTSTLLAHGAKITGTNSAYGNGAISVLLPPDAVQAVAAAPGLHVMNLTTRPITNVGKTTSQGTVVMRSDQANANGITGTGITVGVMSDTYDSAQLYGYTIHAADDIASGDLVRPKFVLEATGFAALLGTDEGRAMMQIVHDVAPGADLCFATAGGGEAAFAASIRRLRTEPTCQADVIVDDVFYLTEPFFSDGQIAQAVNDVSTSTTLAGKPVAYFSSAGNQGSLYNPIAGAGGTIDVAKAAFSNTPTGLGNIDLSTIAACNSSPATGNTKTDTAGGWLDFGGGTYAIELTLSANGGRLVMQWDDPFLVKKLTTDLNLYVFDANGSCYFTAATNNISSDSAVEDINISSGAGGKMRIMVARAGAHNAANDAWMASRIRLFNVNGFSGPALSKASSPATFGHSAAASANSVAAYVYTNPMTQQSPFMPAIEPFTSPGPVTIAFDTAGNRLPSPDIRKKPDMAAPDRVNTTFFPAGSDSDGDGFPNFAGTSAAAPHAAAVAALMLQKAGGPGKLTPKQVKSILQNSIPARVLPNTGTTEKSKAWSPYDGYGLIDAVNAVDKIPAP